MNAANQFLTAHLQTLEVLEISPCSYGYDSYLSVMKFGSWMEASKAQQCVLAKEPRHCCLLGRQ